MKYVWEDLPKPLNCFTVRGTSLINLNTGKIVTNYSANTKIVVVQKCVTPKVTYYRTAEAAHHYLNYAFRASAFGLPNEKAPSVHSSSEHKSSLRSKKPATRTLQPAKKKQKSTQHVASSKDGGTKNKVNWFKKLFGRKHGNAKNS